MSKTVDFESRLEKAKAILEKLMNPEITLETSVKAYEEGMKELKAAQQMLEDAQLKVINMREEGRVKREEDMPL
ncbi:MAG: exodeoxyribonuclease VII small subunit [Campylobacterota bacterium]|nr:exodeoxyribonuclease VII small subunit [Campylobacterota bacterium]